MTHLEFEVMAAHTPVDGKGVTRLSFSKGTGYRMRFIPELRIVVVTNNRDPEWHNEIPMENIPSFKFTEESLKVVLAEKAKKQTKE